MNTVFLIGNLGKEIELNTSKTGKAYTRNSIAVRDGFNKDKTHWFNLTFFGKSAEILEKYCKKGSKLAIQGNLNHNTYEKDGKKMSTVDVTVNNFEMLDKKAESNNDIPDDVPF